MKGILLALAFLALATSTTGFADDEIVASSEESGQIDQNGEPVTIDMRHEENSQARENEARSSLDHEVNDMEGPVHLVTADDIKKDELSYDHTIEAAQPPPPEIIDRQPASDSRHYKERLKINGAKKTAKAKHLKKSKKKIAKTKHHKNLAAKKSHHQRAA